MSKKTKNAEVTEVTESSPEPSPKNAASAVKKPMSALDRAKAKRAEKAAQQAADDSTADTENRD